MATLVVTVGQREVKEFPKSGIQRLLPDKGPADAREYGEILLGLLKEIGESILDDLGAPMVEPSITWLLEQDRQIDNVMLVCTDQLETDPTMATTDTQPIAEVLERLLNHRFPIIAIQQICLKNINPSNDEQVAPAIRHQLQSVNFNPPEKCYVLPQGGTPAMKYQSIFALLDSGSEAIVLRAVPQPGQFYSRIEINKHVPELISTRTVLGNMRNEAKRLCDKEDFAGAFSVIASYPGMLERNPTLALLARIGRLLEAWDFDGLRQVIAEKREAIAGLDNTFYHWLARLLAGSYVEAFQVSLAEIRKALENHCAVLAMTRYYNALELGCASRLEHLWAFGRLTHEAIDMFLVKNLPKDFSNVAFGELRCAAGGMPQTWRVLPDGREICSASVPQKAQRILACFGPNTTSTCPLKMFNKRYSMYRALRTLMGRASPGEQVNPVRFRHEGPYAHDSSSVSMEKLSDSFEKFTDALGRSDSPELRKLSLAVKDKTDIYAWIRSAFEACELPVAFDPYASLRSFANRFAD